MRREDRLRSSSDFDRVLGQGQRLTYPEFVLYHAARDALGRPRVGLVVSRRIGGAVVRNRTKRLLREASRGLIPRLAACDVVIVARPAITTVGVRELSDALSGAAARAGIVTTDS